MIWQVSFSALHKDHVNVLDIMERVKNEEEQNVVDVADIERLKLELAFICTYVQLSYFDLEQFEEVMTVEGQDVETLVRSFFYDHDNNFGCKYDMHHVLASLRVNIDHCISSHLHYTTMTEEQLDFLLLNIHQLSKFVAEHKFPLVTQYEILRMCVAT